MAMQSLRSLLQASVTEKPTEIESCLELLEMWLDSRNGHEQERAMWCATCVLGFTVNVNNFQAFAEYFTRSQLRDLVLEAIEGLTDSKAKLSLAAAQLMKAVMEERGRDMTKVEDIVDGVLEQFNSSLEARTEEETLQAMCSLALSNTIAVVPVLLSKPLPWDSSTLALWKAFGTQRNTSLKVVQLLTRFLEKTPSREDTVDMDAQPVVEREPVRISATSALGHMLSRDRKYKPGATMKRELYTFLLPLLLNMQEGNSEMVKACGGALAEWAELTGWASLTRSLRHTTLSDPPQVLQDTCVYLVSESLNVHPGDRTVGSVDRGGR
ncbi:maestro heat-like repeat-containing protein family member 1 [Lemur catta]|uniref:maestro heat-like repeat-containing protein family member 1 n=1 Tax=Lemur catta TaxID=9447 RepID=UPI001E26C5CC|nr:maestro heat-like repeat-containing protein family member 1 [Lemur catta]